MDKKPSSPVSFADIVGQERLKEALLAVSVHDELDGLLVRGAKGTAKSTAVRALRELLPAQEAVADCPYGCHPRDSTLQCTDCRTRAPDTLTVETRSVPLVTLPLGATRDRVVGTLSVTNALDGESEFDPGLLARVHRGILYVDEINLLADHLVDVLLDAAASGVNHVERDGVSVTHPASFTLVGTMNPEEGDLRPQLRDRFALQVEVEGCTELEDRVAILDQVLTREESPDNPSPPDWNRDDVIRARTALDSVTIPHEQKVDVVTLCRDAGIEGHRGDIAIARAARTLAALDGRRSVTDSDLERAASYALPHRLKSRPFDETPDTDDLISEHFDDADGEDEGEAENGDANSSDEEGVESDSGPDEADTNRSDAPSEHDEPGESDDSDDNSGSGTGEKPDSKGSDSERPLASATPGTPTENDPNADESGDSPPEDESEDEPPLIPGQSQADVGSARAPSMDVPEVSDHADDESSGTRSGVDGPDKRGAHVRTERFDPESETSSGIDAAASVRSAAARGSDAVESRDLRQSVRAGTSDALVLFAVDASASMRGPMRTAKGVALELLQDAYEQRDAVSLVTFAGDDADVLLPPTDSVTLAARHLKELPTGDRTPLPAGLQTTCELLERADPATAVVVLVTDGRATAADGSPTEQTRAAAKRLASQDVHVLVVDAGDETGRDGLLSDIVSITDGQRVPLSALSADSVDRAVGQMQSN
jgi:magnesium chelatase subunit D